MVADERRGLLITSAPPRHCRQGLYLASRGLFCRHVGQIGRLQQLVVNTLSVALPSLRDVLPLDCGVKAALVARGGRDDEQAKHSISTDRDMSNNC